MARQRTPQDDASWRGPSQLTETIEVSRSGSGSGEKLKGRGYSTKTASKELTMGSLVRTTPQNDANWRGPSDSTETIDISRSGSGSGEKLTERGYSTKIIPRKSTTGSPGQALDISLQKIGLANKSASEFNNFYTPDNQLFHSTTPYQVLDSSRQEVRFLKVFQRKTYREHIKAKPQWAPRDTRTGQPLPDRQVADLMARYGSLRGDLDYQDRRKSSNHSTSKQSGHRRDKSSGVEIDPEEKLIACELVDKVALSKVSGVYCTLSYCAGNPKDTAIILVDGIPFNAFANLEHAMGCALKSWTARNPGKELLLWADQICINQTNDVERGRQVGMMRDIYRRSKETFVCLSSPQSGDCLSWVLDIPINATLGKNPTIGAPEENHNISNLKRFIKTDLTSANGKVSTSLMAWLDHLEEFSNSPLWCRSWIYQELIVSPRASILSGSKSVLWKDISPILQFICEDLAGYLENQISNAKLRSAQEYNTSGRIHQPKLESYQQKLQKHKEEYIRNIGRLRGEFEFKLSSAESLLYKQEQSLSNKLSDVKVGIELASKRAESTKRWSRSTQRELHHEVQRLKDREIRLQERIRKHRSIQDQCSKSKKILLQSLETSIEKQTIIEILSNHRKILADQFIEMKNILSNHRDEWSTQIFLQEWEYVCSATHLPDPPDMSDCPTYLEDWKITTLYLRSLEKRLREINTSAIHSVVESKMSARWSPDLKAHLKHSRNCKASDPRDRVYAFLGLAKEEYAIVPNYSSKNTIIHVLINVSKRIIEHERTLHILEHVSSGREELGCLLPSWVADWTSRGTRHILNEFEKQKDFDASKGLPAEAVFEEDKLNASNMDMIVKGVRVGTIDDLEDPIQDFPDLQAFLTGNGLRVITSLSALVDDQVWVLHGASKPVVLRPEGARYSFLCEALVYNKDGTISDVMFGGMINLATHGLAKMKEISIM